MYIISNQDIIVVFSSAKTLQISYIGMQTQEVAIKPNLRVVLKSDAQLIDEVVVTGYGVTKKAAFTGSAQTVDNKDLMKKTDANFMKSLEGSVAGLQVNSLTGQPGAYASTTIRGVGSMNSGTEPLYVIDGIAIYTDKMGAYNKAGTGDMAASPPATNARILFRESAVIFSPVSKFCKNQITIVAIKITVNALCRKSFALSHKRCPTFLAPGRR